MPASRTSTNSLLYVASPATAPAASHQRGSFRSSARITRSETSGQTTRSSDEVRNACPSSRTAEVVAIPQAVQVWALAAPPSSRVISAVTTRQAAAQRVAGTRSSHGPPSYREAMPCATSGVSGGWST